MPSKKVLWGVFRGLNTFLEGFVIFCKLLAFLFLVYHSCFDVISAVEGFYHV